MNITKRTQSKNYRIIYANARNLNTKMPSLMDIIGNLNPDIMLINELGTKENIEIIGFKCIQRNRDFKKGGDMLIAIDEKYNNQWCEM